MCNGRCSLVTGRTLFHDLRVAARFCSSHRVALYGGCDEPYKLCMAMEYMQRGLLYELLRKSGTPPSLAE